MRKYSLFCLFIGFLAVWLTLVGCSGLRTPEDKHQRSLSIQEKELYLERTKDDGYNNCRGAGLSDEVCREKYGIPLDSPESQYQADKRLLTLRTRNEKRVETIPSSPPVVTNKNY